MLANRVGVVDRKKAVSASWFAVGAVNLVDLETFLTVPWIISLCETEGIVVLGDQFFSFAKAWRLSLLLDLARALDGVILPLEVDRAVCWSKFLSCTVGDTTLPLDVGNFLSKWMFEALFLGCPRLFDRNRCSTGGFLSSDGGAGSLVLYKSDSFLRREICVDRYSLFLSQGWSRSSMLPDEKKSNLLLLAGNTKKWCSMCDARCAMCVLWNILGEGEPLLARL